jgi:hypothetical protein
MICMGRTELKKVTQDCRGSLILSLNFLACFITEQKDNKLAGGICHLPRYEENFGY